MAAAAPFPPRQSNNAVAAIQVENFEGDVAVIMGLLRLKTDKVFLILTLDPTPANDRARGLTSTRRRAIRSDPVPRIPRRRAHRPAIRTHRPPTHPAGFARRPRRSPRTPNALPAACREARNRQPL